MVASWLRHRPPAPRKVGRPDAADSPAPHKAMMRRLPTSFWWKASILLYVLDGAMVLLYERRR